MRKRNVKKNVENLSGESVNIKTIKKWGRRFFHAYAVIYKTNEDDANDKCWGLYLKEVEAEETALFVKQVMEYKVVFTSQQIVWVE